METFKEIDGSPTRKIADSVAFCWSRGLQTAQAIALLIRAN